jgi:hypothetical protein
LRCADFPSGDKKTEAAIEVREVSKLLGSGESQVAALDDVCGPGLAFRE